MADTLIERVTGQATTTEELDARAAPAAFASPNEAEEPAHLIGVGTIPAGHQYRSQPPDPPGHTKPTPTSPTMASAPQESGAHRQARPPESARAAA